MLKYICKIVTQDTFQRWIILSLYELFYIHVLALHWYLFYFFFAESRNRMFTAVVEMLRWFAGHQIRNVAVSACRFKCIIFFYVYDICYYIYFVSFKICTFYSMNQPKLGRKFWRKKKHTQKCQILSQLSYFCVYSVKIVKDEFQVIGCYFLCRSHSKQQKYQYLDW